MRRGKRRKNDPNDALDIALRLSRGECPLGYIADPQLMQLRKFGRHWRQLSRSLAKAKQGMKSMLNAANTPVSLFQTADTTDFGFGNLAVGNGEYLKVGTITAVPEPSTWVAAGMAAAIGFSRYLRRRTRQ